MTPRQEKVLVRIDLARQRGLEIGALDKPLLTADVADVRYVDYATTEDLRAAHAHTPTVDAGRIVPVHYVWGEKTLREAVGEEVLFDYVVASHVIEHVPDLVTWFEELAEIVKPGGVVSLIVPDKRYIFDRLRQPSQFAEIVEAWLERRRKPSLRQIFDYLSLHARVDPGDMWAGRSDAVERVHDEAFALARCREAVASGRYVDAHCWVFTPESFFAHVRRLSELGMFRFAVAAFFPTARGEIDFFVTFERLSDDLAPDARLRRQLAALPSRFDAAVPDAPAGPGAPRAPRLRDRLLRRLGRSAGGGAPAA